MAIANDGKYSFSAKEQTLFLTALRSPVYAWHDPAKLQENVDYCYMDQGLHEFTYSIVPIKGNWRSAKLTELGAALIEPPLIMEETFHKGSLPLQKSFARVQGGAIVNVFKLSRDKQAYIVRGYDPYGIGGVSKLSLPTLSREIELDFRPYEIKTVRIPFDPALPAIETNILEDFE
jgi:alpha-mannosidase